MPTVTAKCLLQHTAVPTSVAAVYTVPSLTRAIIDQATVSNPGGSSHTYTIYLVPSGGSPSNSNKLLEAVSLASGLTDVLDKLRGHILEAGDSVQALGSASNNLTIRLSGREIA